MRSIIMFFVSACFIAALSHAEEYNAVRPDSSSIIFVFKQMNVPVEGLFQRFTSQLLFEPSRPERGKAQIEIDMNSIDVGNKDGNAEVRGRNWFDTEKYPTAKFVSEMIISTGIERYEVSGKLTMKGQTKELKAPFTMKQGLLEGGLVIKRLEWGIGAGIWRDTETVADEVRINFRLTAVSGKKGNK